MKQIIVSVLENNMKQIITSVFTTYNLQRLEITF